MNTTLIKEAKNHVSNLLSSLLESASYYHNTDHTLMVFESCKTLGEKSNLSSKNQESLLLAALFHDVGFIEGAAGHEKRSAKTAEDWLISKNYPKEQIDIVKDVILCTMMDARPQTLLQKLIKDADLCHLANKDYLSISTCLRKEKEHRTGEKIKNKQWLKTNITFFEKHEYYSDAAKVLYGPGKLTNLAGLRKLEKKKKKKKKKKSSSPIKNSSISGSKAANTQFKTALRNHIDLSAIADNKANMMLSVNALILTISIPALGIQITDHPNMIIPFALLMITCMLSIIYATLATKPIVMTGTTEFNDIKNLNANLFFFGNFYKMARSKYQEGIQYVIDNEDSLDSSIIKDLFDLGRALGGKYKYLSICYTIFMFGLIGTSISFLAVLLFIRFSNTN